MRPPGSSGKARLPAVPPKQSYSTDSPFPSRTPTLGRRHAGTPSRSQASPTGLTQERGQARGGQWALEGHHCQLCDSATG